MSENVMMTPLFHQRSHSMPVGHTFINGSPVMNGNGMAESQRTYDFKRSSPLKPETISSVPHSAEGFPLPMPKSLASQFRTNSTAMANTSSSATATTADHENSQTSGEQEPTFFCRPKTILDVFDYNRKGSSCPVILNCKMDKGFFVSHSYWTCYRRNYFQVTASVAIPGYLGQNCYALQLGSDMPMQPIQQFFLRLKACTSSTSSTSFEDPVVAMLENHNMVRPIALTQMTPKRDKGPQYEPPLLPITPSDNVYGNDQVCVTFERLQFRVATANNGKRRASQQYFRLIFQLVAQLVDSSQHVVSECYSTPLVVRGRSPGHYSSEPHQQRDLKKKRKLTPPTLLAADNKPITTKRESESPPSFINKSVASPSIQQPSSQHVVTLPPPQYVYAPPPMVVDASRHNDSSNTTSVAQSPASYHQQPPPQMMPHMMSSAFTNFHSRSQSANDSDFLARHHAAIKYQPTIMDQQQQQQQDGLFDNYSGNVGIEGALRNWQQQQQQAVRQRTDSGTTFDAYMPENDSRSSSTRPGYYYNSSTTPSNNWPRQPYMDDHHEEKRCFNEQKSPKLYQHHPSR